MTSPSACISEAIEGEATSLYDLSKAIWSKPEEFYREVFAHDTLTKFLEEKGFDVERQYAVDTAFRAVYRQGQGGAHVVVICEYDALPTIGHACGHNLIAEAGAAAGLGLKAALESNPSVSGTVTVLGTPAEETGGGKVDLIKAGAFQGIDIAMMVHPDQQNMMQPVGMAVNTCTVTFKGRATHAAASPWEGLNALDAAVSAYNLLAMLRQQTKTDCRLHAVITEGGVRPNIIPERAVIKFSVRAPFNKELAVLKDKATEIMKSSAKATGCEVEMVYANPEGTAEYSNLVHNHDLIQRFQSHWEGFGPQCAEVVPDRVWASTDMGNVSYVVPSIHPTFNIGTTANIHTRDFAAAAMTPEAHAATRCAAKAMACVCWDVLTDQAFLQKVQESFKSQLNRLQY